MHKRVIGLLIAALGAVGLVLATANAGDAAAFEVREVQDRTLVMFTHEETEKIADLGIGSLLDQPAVRARISVSPDTESLYEAWYVPATDEYVGEKLATRLVREAAEHPNGTLWVSINESVDKPFTIWTRW